MDRDLNNAVVKYEEMCYFHQDMTPAQAVQHWRSLSRPNSIEHQDITVQELLGQLEAKGLSTECIREVIQTGASTTKVFEECKTESTCLPTDGSAATDRAWTDSFEFEALVGVCKDMAHRIGAQVPRECEVFEALSCVSSDWFGEFSLTSKQVARLVQQQIQWHQDDLGFGSLRKKSPDFQAIESQGKIQVSIGTMEGSSWTIDIEDSDTGLDLKNAINAEKGVLSRNQKLLFDGMVLVNTLALYEMGIHNGASIFLLRLQAPPQSITLQRPERDDTHGWTLGTCSWFYRACSGEYIVQDFHKDERPTYKMERGTDRQWDSFIFYEESKKRWVIVDSSTCHVSKFKDAYSWAFCESDAMHPGELAGSSWSVCDNSYHAYVQFPLDLKVAYE